MECVCAGFAGCVILEDLNQIDFLCFLLSSKINLLEYYVLLC